MNLDNDDASPSFDPLNFGVMGGGGGYGHRQGGIELKA